MDYSRKITKTYETKSLFELHRIMLCIAICMLASVIALLASSSDNHVPVLSRTCYWNYDNCSGIGPMGEPVCIPGVDSVPTARQNMNIRYRAWWIAIDTIVVIVGILLISGIIIYISVCYYQRADPVTFILVTVNNSCWVLCTAGSYIMLCIKFTQDYDSSTLPWLAVAAPVLFACLVTIVILTYSVIRDLRQ